MSEDDRGRYQKRREDSDRDAYYQQRRELREAIADLRAAIRRAFGLEPDDDTKDDDE